jgi:hypothetical protein
MIVNINDCNACWEELPPSTFSDGFSLLVEAIDDTQ